MGMADIVPGVSGGTVALIVGIYDELIKSISSVDIKFIKIVLIERDLPRAWNHINGKFLFPLLFGIFCAIIGMSKIIHFFMHEFSVFTWALFFGLIISSIFLVGKMIRNIKKPINIITIVAGSIVGLLVVSSLPINTPDSHFFIFISGAIAICAMILPGISGSFILLILGKYLYVTSALKNPFETGSIEIIIVFAFGCLIGLLSFSRLLNILLKKHHDITMSLLLGFMVGSLRKIWPWKEVLQEKIIRGKTVILSDSVYFPTEINFEVIMAFAIMIFGIVLVILIDRFSCSPR